MMYRTKDILYEYQCSKCGYLELFDMDAIKHGIECLSCGCGVIKETDMCTIRSTDQPILEHMQRVTVEHVQRYESDFEIDRTRLMYHGGNFLWAVRPTGTTLLILGYVHKRKESEGYALFNLGNRVFFYCDGRKLHEVSEEDAKYIWRNECRRY